MKKMLRVQAIVLAVLMLVSLLLTGCGTQNGDKQMASTDSTTMNSVTSNSTDEKGDVKWDKNKKSKVVISTINMYYTAGLQKMAQEYTKLHPETKVEIEIISDNSTYATNFTTKITADKSSAPDIIHTNVAGLDSSAIDKGWIIQLNDMLDEENPYNNNAKVRDAIDEKWLNFAINNCKTRLFYLPFDLVGVGMYYNKTIFDKEGLKVPQSFEELLDICNVLKSKGYEAPIGATDVWNWYLTMFADQAYRKMTKDFLILPGDGMWDEASMIQNKNIQYNPDDVTFDEQAVFNPEKFCIYVKENGIINETNKKIWLSMVELSRYFQKGFVAPDGAKVSADFIAQKTPMMINGSWIVGKFVDDIKKLPSERQFDWGTFKLPGFADGGDEFPGKIRSLLVPGNLMGAVNKDDPDQNARTLDVLKYWYSPQVAKMIYDETLTNGNYVQGPPLIKGVQLSDEINGYLNGFLAEGSMKWEYQDISGHLGVPLAADLPVGQSLFLKTVEGEITIDEFLKEFNKLVQNANDDKIKKNGYDLDPKTKDTPPGN